MCTVFLIPLPVPSEMMVSFACLPVKAQAGLSYGVTLGCAPPPDAIQVFYSFLFYHIVLDHKVLHSLVQLNWVLFTQGGL